MKQFRQYLTESSKEYLNTFNFAKPYIEPKQNILFELDGGTVEEWYDGNYHIKGPDRKDITGMGDQIPPSVAKDAGITLGEIDTDKAKKIVTFFSKIENSRKYNNRLIPKYSYLSPITFALGGNWRDLMDRYPPRLVTKWRTWMLSVVKEYLLHVIIEDLKHFSHDENEIKKLEKKRKTRTGTMLSIRDERDLMGEIQGAFDDIKHYLDTDIPKILNFDFNSLGPGVKLDFGAVFEIFEEIVGEHMAESREEVDKLEDTETLIKYDDGWEWQNLHTVYCKFEGDAMGHCGNSADWKDGDQVISLRKYNKDNKKWRPSLTFIVRKGGKLGEAKGRKNSKPKEEYHDKIIDLLTYKEGGEFFIDKIIGGGHAPKMNFKLEDLSEDNQRKLFLVRKDWAPLRFLYKEVGKDEVIPLLKDKLEEDSEYDYVIEDEKIKFWLFNNLEELIEFPKFSAELKTFKYYFPFITGDTYVAQEFDFHSFDYDHYKDELIDYIHESDKDEINKAIKTHFPDFEGTLKEFLEEELGDSLNEAILVGLEIGTDTEINKTFFDAIKDLKLIVYGDNDSEFDFYIIPEGASPLETRYGVEVDFDSYFKLFATDEELETWDDYHQYGDIEIKGDMEEPYHGFLEYDNKYAYSDFINSVEYFLKKYPTDPLLDSVNFNKSFKEFYYDRV